MLTNISKKLERVYTAFAGLGKASKMILKYGCILFLGMLVTGLVLMLLNSNVISYSSYLDLISKSLVKSSFQVATEVIVGALILDFAFKK